MKGRLLIAVFAGVISYFLAAATPLHADFNYSDFGSTAGLTFNGSAAQSSNRLRITPSSSLLRGSAWHVTKQSVKGGFETTFQFQISNKVYLGGDGFAFVIQNDKLTSLGCAGMGIGYAPAPFNSPACADGIPNSLAIEFDMWDNHDRWPGEPNDNHISVHTRGVLTNSADEAYSIGVTTSIPNMKDGNVHTVRITYQSGLLKVYMDDLQTVRLTVAVNLSSLLNLDNGAACVGFTSGTGGAYQTHDILNWSFTTATLTGVTISGPSTVSAGSVTPYTCIATFSNGGTLDVSAQTTWTIDPPDSLGSQMSGNWLIATSGALLTDNHSVSVKATYATGGETRTAIKSVTIQPQFKVSIGTPNATYSCSPSQWSVTLTAFATAGSGSVAYAWDLDGDGNFNDGSGQQVTGIFPAGGNRLIGVQATDGTGAHATAFRYLTLNRPESVLCGGTPVTLPLPATDVLGGAFKSSTGGTFSFDPAKINNGLIVLVHGACASGTDAWVQDMASKIVSRLGASAAPNICLYDWHEMANPDQFNGRGSSCPLLPNGIDDLLTLRGYGLAHGLLLANWIRDNIAAGYINPAKPIHIIGHSAGGFVAGNCAGVLGSVVRQITTLDTPLPPRSIIDSYVPSGGTNDAYKTIFGTSLVAGGLSKPPGYRFEKVPDANPGQYTDHEWSHEWYARTISNTGSTDGFYYSPWLGHSLPQQALAMASASKLSAQSLQDQPITGFSTFGSVNIANGTNALTEAADAGIYKTIALPIGAQSLKFSYRFTSPGDGDFLSVHWGTNNLLYVGLDLPISEDGFVDADVSLAEFAGQTDQLTFTLVSRNTTNAILSLANIRMSISDDPDGDGLTTDQEIALGTDPLKYDTDGDSVSDGDEVNIYGTNPLVADTDGDGMSDGQEIKAGTNPNDASSVFRITSIRQNGGTNTITWTSATGKTYDVFRTTDLSWNNFTTLTNGIAATPPVNTFADVPPVSLSNFFYRVGAQ